MPTDQERDAQRYGYELPDQTEHKPICEEFWERGLDCRCIPQSAIEDIRNGADPNDVLGPEY